MTAKWITEVAVADLQPEQHYFIARCFGTTGLSPHYDFLGQGLNGKQCWTVKPGIGIRFLGRDPALLKVLAEHPEFKAVAVPPDADKRWSKRRRW